MFIYTLYEPEIQHHGCLIDDLENVSKETLAPNISTTSLIIHAIAACNPVFGCIPYGQVVTPRNYPTASPPCIRGWSYFVLVPSSAPSPAFHSTSSSHCINPGTNYRCFMGVKTMTSGIV